MNVSFRNGMFVGLSPKFERQLVTIDERAGITTLENVFITHLAPKNFWTRLWATWVVLKTYWGSHKRIGEYTQKPSLGTVQVYPATEQSHGDYIIAEQIWKSTAKLEFPPNLDSIEKIVKPEEDHNA